MPYEDGFCRAITYLRISVTDRCNLRCTYCMPLEGVAHIPHERILRYEEIARVAEAAADLGMSKVRITGGEPLVRADLPVLVRMLADLPGIEDLSMTTNGILLARYAKALREAGLHRVNVSLDTLDPAKYRRITRLGDLEEVLAGIQAAREAGLAPVKINAVILRGLNDDELLRFAERTLYDDWNVRFIEVMPFEGDALDWERAYLPAGEMKARIEDAFGPLQPEHGVHGNGPARYYRLPGARGTLGFISPVSEHFCARCNRMRLTADGYLRPCLLSDLEIDLRTPLRQGATRAQLQELLLGAIRCKPKEHALAAAHAHQHRPMSQIGG
ncbi:MAG: GTP 3',8-cyclase MoaA [Anaerolineae bacterium]|nr:GTP 3',8-cyclase MoaA [Anaerolineae bacterium]